MTRLTTGLLLISSILFFSGCNNNLNVVQKPKIDLNLPIIESSSIKSISSINSIALEWKSITSSGLAGYNIYRSNMQLDGTKFQRIATLDNKYVTHYLDKDVNANSKYSYTISIINKHEVESAPSEAVIVSTLPNFKSVSLIKSLSGLPRQIKILWRPHGNPAVSKYILERTSPTSSKWKKLATIKNRYNIEYIDDELGDNQTFSYRLKAVTFDGIISQVSAISIATTKPLPSQASNLIASRNLPRNIKISWEPSKTKDIVFYNIYSASTIGGTFNKIAQAPMSHNRFDNNIALDGKIYFYKITTVDKDGLESNIKEVEPVMGSTLGKPKTPKVTLAQIQGDKIILNWVNSDNRAVSYNVYKSEQRGWNLSKAKLIPNIIGLRFEDLNVVRGVEYRYAIQAVDANGLVSLKTKPLSSMLPKLDKQIKE